MKIFNIIHLIFINIIIINITINPAENNADKYRYPIPINSAEAVLEIFWDPDISDFPKWQIESGDKYGLKVFQNWGAVDFQWDNLIGSAPVVRMSRNVKADCSLYNCLILSMTPPENAVIKITVMTEKGTLEFKSDRSKGDNNEYRLELLGAKKIENIIIELYSDRKEGSGWFNWILLENTERLKYHLDQWRHFDDEWEKHIKPDDFMPSFKPSYGIFISDEELSDLRKLHEESLKETQISPFINMGNKALNYKPEASIREFSKDNIRIRDNIPVFSGKGLDAAIAGIVLKDKDLLKIACRHALSLAVCGYWDVGFSTQFSISAWELRGFRQSYNAKDVAWILDIAGEMFTDAGKKLLLRQLADLGVNPINFITWKHDYIFNTNQLAFFNTGRIDAYLVLEKEYPRVKHYTDIAYKELIYNIKESILRDGGYVEGPGYFSAIVRRNYNLLQEYSKARKTAFPKEIIEIFKKTGNYAAAISSTTSDIHLSICDSNSDNLGFDTILPFAALFPDSYWVTMFRKELSKDPGKLKDPFDIILSKKIRSLGTEVPIFINLHETGYIASHRKFNDKMIKIFIMGNRRNSEHCHEDKGSFIIEYAGECFAEDPGIGSYDDPLHKIYKKAYYHNMLFPVGTKDIAAPENPLPYDVKPAGIGNKTKFNVKINAAPGWSNYFKKWERQWISKTPEHLIIRDDYELFQGTEVEFFWQTSLPCEIKEDKVIISGKKGSMIITSPADCFLRIDELPLQNGKVQKRIVIQKKAIKGILEVHIRFVDGI